MDIALKGLTWDHPRGYAPLINGAHEYERRHTGLRIHWNRRTLREFGEAPIEQYLDQYDLIVVDHPFVGFAAAHHVLLNLSSYLDPEEKLAFEHDSVGQSWPSYWYGGGLWALPIDAATQVACYRPDLFGRSMFTLPATFDDVLVLGSQARSISKFIIVPACPTDAVSLFFTLTAGLCYTVAEDSEPFVVPAVGREVLKRLQALIVTAHPKSVDWNPIQVYDFMLSNTDAVYCPYGFGYSNYSRIENRVRLQFTDAPGVGILGSSGTMLGGTGISVSAKSAHQREAVEYAKWVASKDHQRGTYFRKGGQPASLAAWTDPDLDDAAGNFFSRTLCTLRGAYLRPRFDGFVRFFEAAGIEINRFLRGEVASTDLVEWLNTKYANSKPTRQQAKTVGRSAVATREWRKSGKESES
jgi:multiple sugar transport system substrate-binding protein